MPRKVFEDDDMQARYKELRDEGLSVDDAKTAVEDEWAGSSDVPLQMGEAPK